MDYRAIDPDIGYYFITDSQLSLKGNLNDVEAACKAGVSIVQYREKNKPMKDQYHEASKLMEICSRYGVIFLINNHIDLCLAVNADGVHLGPNDMPYPIARKLLGKKKIIGVSVKNLQAAMIAAFSHASYIGFGAVYKTNTKTDAVQNQGLDQLKLICSQVDVPVVGIGGINIDRAPDVLAAGVNGLCAISDVVGAESVADQITAYQKLFYRGNND